MDYVALDYFNEKAAIGTVQLVAWCNLYRNDPIRLQKLKLTIMVIELAPSSFEAMEKVQLRCPNHLAAELQLASPRLLLPAQIYQSS